MTELHGYWTPGFTKLYEAALNADPAFQKATKSFKGTFLFRAMDTPWGTDAETTYEVDHGTVVASPSVRPAPWVEMRNAPFDKHAHFARATAPFAIWAKLDRSTPAENRTVSATVTTQGDVNAFGGVNNDDDTDMVLIQTDLAVEASVLGAFTVGTPDE